MKNIIEKINKEVSPAMKEKFGYTNDYQVPKVQKVVLNVGIGRLAKEGDKVEEILKDIEAITGQKPVKTMAKKSIAGFKLREGQEVGIKVTLRKKRMYDFLDRLINSSLPRIRDFQGINEKAVDKNGDLNIGIREQIIFPEINPENVKFSYGFQITVSTTAKNHEEGVELLKLIGFPIVK